MSGNWEVKSGSWINPMELFVSPVYPRRRYWVVNRETGEWRVIEVESGQSVGDAIAEGQFVDTDDDTEAPDTESIETDTEDDDSSEDDSWYDDDSSYSDDSSYDWSPHPDPSPPRENPTEVAEQLFGAAETASEIELLCARFAGQLPQAELDRLCSTHTNRVNETRLDDQLQQIRGRSSKQLKAEWFKAMSQNVAAGNEPGAGEAGTLLELEHLARTIEETNDLTRGQLEFRRMMHRSFNPAAAILARRRLAQTSEEEAASAFHALGHPKDLELRTLESYFFRHQYTAFATKAIKQVHDKVFLMVFIKQSPDPSLTEVAKDRLATLLRWEHQRRSIFEKLLYNLLFRKLETERGVPCPDWLVPRES